MSKPVGAMPSGMPGTHFAQLDGLRGLAILLVMMYHFSLPYPGAHSHDAGLVLQLAQAGWMGVDLFFVLSGFLITGILVDTRGQKHNLRNFLGRRFLRIWPLYYLSLLVLLVLMPMVLPSVPAALQSMRDKQAWFWLYGANWLFAIEGGFSRTSGGYFWSLAVEEQFYLLWPFVVYALSDRALLRTSLALLCLSVASRIVLVSIGVSTGSLYTMTFTHLDGLAVGSCLAICMRSPELSSRVKRYLPIAAAVAGCGLVAVRVADRDLFFWSKNMATYGYTFIVILFGALLLRVVWSDRGSSLNRFFSSGVMTQFGKYSYALYMVHVPVASLMFPLTYRALARFDSFIGYEGVYLVFVASSFCISWGLSVASWYVFERRILALKRHFSYSEDVAAPKLASEPR
jgi:peptidoglycan/LPS O-acetylase OafA/YrhL